jgi:hypothetical protein
LNNFTNKALGTEDQLSFSGSFVGADPQLTNAETWLDLKRLLEKFDSKFVSVENIIDQLWTEETGRPPFVVRTFLFANCRVNPVFRS